MATHQWQQYAVIISSHKTEENWLPRDMGIVAIGAHHRATVLYKFVLDYVEKNILFIFCPHPSVWYLSSCSVADMRSFCDNIKRIPFREENREFLVAIPLIHQISWTSLV